MPEKFDVLHVAVAEQDHHLEEFFDTYPVLNGTGPFRRGRCADELGAAAVLDEKSETPYHEWSPLTDLPCPFDHWQLARPQKKRVINSGSTLPAPVLFPYGWLRKMHNALRVAVAELSPVGRSGNVYNARHVLAILARINSSSTPPAAVLSPDGWSGNMNTALHVAAASASVPIRLSSPLSTVERLRKRIRSRNWSVEETRKLLELAKGAPRQHAAPDWDYISGNLFEMYGFDRASASCEKQWGSVLRSYRAIRDNECKIRNGMNGCATGYWEMDALTRCRNTLPQTFDLECYEMMESIPVAKPFELETGVCQIDPELGGFVEFSGSDEGQIGSADRGDWPDEESDSKMVDVDTHCEEEGLSGESAGSVDSEAEVTSYGHDPRTEPPRQDPCCETNSKYAGGKRSLAATLDKEDDLVAKITPFVNKLIENALQPVISALRGREEEVTLAVEKEKLALMRQKLELTRRMLADSKAFSARFLQTRAESQQRQDTD